MKRRWIAVLLTTTLVVGSSMSVWAAEKTDVVLENETQAAAEEEISVLESLEMPEDEAWDESAESLEAAAEEAETGEETVTLAEAEFPMVDENGLTWELTDGVLTISGNGVIEKNEAFTFERKEEVASIVIGEGITGIGNSVFNFFTNLEAVSVPGSVTTIGDFAFYGCKRLTDISISNSVSKIGNSSFRECGVETVVIPASLAEIGDQAFRGCGNLINVSFSDGVTKITSNVFRDCRNLKGVAIPNGVTEIAYGAFAGCSRLPEVTIPDTVKSLGSGTFYDCVRLKSVVFKGDAPEVDDKDILLIYKDLNQVYIEEPFRGVTATAVYPAGNQTYTEEVRTSYGGELTWKAREEKPALTFSDVSEDDWYYQSANFVSSRGIMTGMNDTEFGPGVKLSRAQFATILYRMAGEPNVLFDGAAFTDVEDGQFYTYPVMWAKETGVISGYEDGRFGPSDDITREQMAVMMYRYANVMGLDTSAKDDLSGFPDADRISSFAVDGVQWAVGEGLIQGDGGNVNPRGIAERAQCATIIMRFMEAYEL